MLVPSQFLAVLPLLACVQRLGAERNQEASAASGSQCSRPRWQTPEAIVEPSWEAFFEAADGIVPCESSLAQTDASPPNLLKFFKPTRKPTFAGSGAFGSVDIMHLQCPGGCSKASCPNGPPPEFPVAVKQLWFKDTKTRADIFKERELMSEKFTGRQFPKLLDTEEVAEKNTVFLTMEAAKGDFSKVKKEPLQYKARLFADAMYGVQEVHRLGYIHRDLKPQNIFLSWDQKHALIGDFGLTVEQGEDMESEAVGTPLYLASEVSKTATYSTKQDVWAMGVSFYEVVFGKRPDVFYSAFVEKQMDLIYNFDITDDSMFQGLDDWVSEQELPEGTDADKVAEAIRDLLIGTLQTNPAERIDATEALDRAKAISEALGNTGDVEEGIQERPVQGETLCDKYHGGKYHQIRF